MTHHSSPAQVAANQANAARSTGPRTEAGKSRSRANALKHGLTAQILDLEGLDAGTAPVYHASGRLDIVWVTGEIMRTTVQIDRVYRIELKLRAEVRFRAEMYWVEDRTADAAALGAKLGRNPEWTVAQLRKTPYGCSWLITRWECLKLAAANPDGWNECQRKLAFDLLGVPAEGRDRSVEEAISFRQFAAGPLLSQHAIAEEMLADLADQKELVQEADEVSRCLAQSDLIDLPTPELARLRRYETALKKQLVWLVEHQQAARPVAPPTAPAPPVVVPPDPPRNEPNSCETKPMPAASQPEPARTAPVLPPLNHPQPTETSSRGGEMASRLPADSQVSRRSDP